MPSALNVLGGILIITTIFMIVFRISDRLHDFSHRIARMLLGSFVTNPEYEELFLVHKKVSRFVFPGGFLLVGVVLAISK